jgi:hypothetical protein
MELLQNNEKIRGKKKSFGGVAKDLNDGASPASPAARASQDWVVVLKQ